MVTIIKKKGKEYFQCRACGMFYKNKHIAENCERWCSKNNSCNIEIIKHAVSLK